MQKIFRLLMVAAAIVLGVFWFVHWSKTRALSSGEVHVRQQTDDKAKSDTSTTVPAKEPDSAARPSQPQQVASITADSRGHSQDGVAAIPAAETFSRNPPNGTVAAGSGKFQLYRQGDMTFRLNTETGQACVLFATDTQWRKPLVYEHGCGSH